MPKKTSLFILMLCLCGLAKAQSADSVYNAYLDFNFSRSQGQEAKALKQGESILPKVDKLPEKSRTTFYNGLAKVYEDDNQPEKAVRYYELVAAAEPNFYVAQRALGYLYLIPAKAINEKMIAAKADQAAYKQLAVQYKQAVMKAMPHLEKAQACDPSNETLSLIKLLYRNIGGTTELKTLDARLSALSKNCMDILSE
jgi:tetratricopeptide (TPR) repeat protein